MNIKTWQERLEPPDHGLGIRAVDFAMQAEIDELRAALLESKDVGLRLLTCRSLFSLARGEINAQRKVLEQAQYALESTLEALEQLGPAYWSERQEEARVAITAIQEQLKMKQQTDVNRVCTITVYGVKIDVVDFYKTHGFKTLPPQLTMSGNDLRMLGEVPTNYSLDGPSQRNIASAQAVPVNDGDEFYAIPPATM